ncbi:SdrD B-like domain-containing protein [Fibrella forsythiae]|uniref:SdrD B-like domain-containing protein n=1 Tax=Fibrella forsythiae TaxID=2817061 RepID=UPI00286D7A00|nr:SdrD B-like domain-containing protein [Fibrella forsythiae]
MTLYQNGSAVATTTTDVSGGYSFTGLASGPQNIYQVGFATPSGFVTTAANVGNNDAIDSDVQMVTGRTGTYTLVAGEFNPTVDAGYYKPASLGDYVFNDKDRNGVQSPGDTPIPGVVVVLYQNGSPVATTTTDVNGLYSFTGLTPGSSNSYSVGFTTPSGFTPTTPQSGTDTSKDSDVNPITGRSQSVTLSSGEYNPTIDGGFIQPTAGLGDYVFEDKNANGVQDAGDVPIPGVLVTLYTSGSAIRTTTTDANGLYSFTSLTPGTPYVVGFGQPAGFLPTLANVGTNDALDSDASVATGLTGVYSLTADEFNPTVDAGFYKPASLGNYVFADVNRNGIQDAGDSPIPGVIVTLYQNGSVIATTTTDAIGLYSFTGLTPGTSNSYSVGFTTPDGYTPTTPRSGTNVADDSDVDPLTGRSQSITLASGENNPTVDGGFIRNLGAIGDYVWFDYNSDGQQGSTVLEPGVAGVTVQLFAASNTTVPLATTTTDGTGKYLFDKLPSGQYVVKFTAPTGSVFTTQNKAGVSPEFDSNAGVVDGLTSIITIDVTQPLSSTARVNLTIDAGIVPYGSIGNYVWRDTNNDGIQNDGNTGIAGITVELFGANNLSVPLAETVTDGTGYYLFDNLIAGNYKVKFTLPTGETFTLTEQGGDRAVDSDPGADGFSKVIAINTALPLGNVGRNNMTIDAGVATKCATPLILVAGTTNMSLCVGGSTSVSAIAVGSSKVNWYLDATAQVLAFTTVSGQPYEVAPTTNLTYYVQAETADGCKSEIKPVVIIVNARPNTPSCLKEVTICKDKMFDLTTVKLNNVPLPGSTLEWHTGISETSPLVTNLTAVGAGEYYLFERSRYGCYSYPAVLTVNAIDCSCQSVAMVSTSLTSGSVCEGDKITLVAQIGGSATGVTWMPSNSATAGTLTGATSLTAMYTPSAADIAAGQVAFTVQTNDPDGNGVCTPAYSTVLVVINKRPDAPLGVACDDEILCRGTSTKLFGFTTGAKINWYANGTFIGSSASGKALVVTPMQSTTYTAIAESAAGCVSVPSEAVIVTVKATCLADLAVVKTVMTAGPYKVGNVISYGITVTNNGPINATAVTVSEMLPAGLEYVSATPAGEYNAATGVWTIGSLLNGSNRSLIIQAKVKGTGSIVNRVVVTGGNDDPSKPEDNTSTVGITVDDCNTPAPTIACAITALCGHDPAESTILTARDCAGTVKWSNGMTGNRIEVFPTVTTTYTASCVVGTCTSTQSNPITVTVTDVQAPTILASADKVCAGGVVSLTAVGCTNGQVYWSDNMTGTVISLTVTAETTITAQCRLNNCYSPSTAKVIKVGNDLPKPTVVCSTTEVCPGETVTLTAQNCVGTPVWSTGEKTASIIVTPTVGNNSYSLQCVDGTCLSPRSDDYTIKVTPAAVPTVVASAASVCTGGVVSLTATGCTGNVTWSNNMTGSVISVTVTSTSSFYAYCKVRDCISNPSQSVTIQVGKPSAPTIRAIPNTAICSGESVTLTVAEGCANGTVKWMPGNLTGSSIVVVPTINTDYTATCVTDNCESAPSNAVKVIVKTAGTAPTVASSAPSVCNGGSVTLTAGNCTNGQVIWSNGMTGSSIVVTPTADANTYSASCKQADKCGSPQSRVITINVTTPPAPTVICSTSVICPGESVDLTIQNCSGTAMWSTGAADNGKTVITVSPTSTTSYSVKCSDQSCMSAPSSLYTITVVPVPVPDVTASSTIISEGESVTLSVSNCPGTVTWNTNQTGSSIVVSPTAAVSYYTATCRFRSCTSDPSITITVRKRGPENCLAKAGTLVPTISEVCASTMTTVALSATDNGGRVVPAGFSVRYVLTKGTDLVIQQTGDTPSFTVPATEAAIYTIHTLVYNPATLDLSTVVLGTTKASDVLTKIQTNQICADLDVTGARTKVKYVPAPVIIGVGNIYRCYGEVVSLTATGCDNGQITWGGGASGKVFTFTVLHDNWFSAVCTVDGCSSAPSQMVDHYLVQLKVPTIGCDKPTVCAGDPATLTAQGCENAGYLWSTGETTSSIVVTPGESTTYAVKCTLNGCQSDWSPACKLTVGQPGTPVVKVNGSTSNVTTCFGSPVTLTASGCPAGAFAIWSNNQVGSSITVNPATTATYTAQCCTSNNCKSKVSNAIVITVLPKVPQPKTTDLTNTCPILAVNLASAVGPVQTTGGTLEYYSSSTLEPATKLTNTNVTASGTYYVVEKTTGGCYSLPAPIQVNITACGDQIPCGDNPVTADAGVDAAVCAAKTYKLNGKATGNNLTTQWTTSGTGTFDNAFSGQALYTPSATDVQAGQVTLTFSAKTNNTACGVKSDALVLTLNGPKEQPTVSVIGATQLCYGDSVKLQAPAGFTYLWSNKATTQSITVKEGGAYSVQVFDQNGCSSVPSSSVAISVAAPVAAPLVVNLRNACPATTVSLSTALGGNTTAGSTYEYRMGESASSALVMNPGVAGDGIYYIFERTANQCVSLPAKVVVKVVDCTQDAGKSADVSIAKLVSNPAAKVGESIKYTLKVTNNGPGVAYNVDVRDVLPLGLNLVIANSPVSYTVSNGAISKRFDSLAVGATDSVVFMARLTKKGSVVNTASITYSDVVDPAANNNTSSVTVTDNSPFKAGLIGLAKEVMGTPTFTNDSTLAVDYRFTVTNFGDEDLTTVGVTDDLEAVFGTGNVLSAQLAVTDGSSKLAIDPAYTGVGAHVQMLAASSTLVAGQTSTFVLSATVHLNKADTAARTYANLATATAMNSTSQVSDVSVEGNDADLDKDGDPTNDSGATLITIPATPKPQAKQIGVAMSVASVVKQADDSYNVTYKVYVKNFGTVALTNVSLLDTIAHAFASPATYSIVSGLVANAGSELIVSSDFDGNATPYYFNSHLSRLAAGKADTLTYTVNVKPNGANGPFYSQVYASAKPEGTTLTVTDKSNTGSTINPDEDSKTAVRFDLPSALMGVAKAVGTPVRVSNTVWDVPYSIKVCNLGSVDLKQVQVVDDLSKAFGHGAQVTSVTVTADAGLKVNAGYTGVGLLTNMLDTTASTLPAKAIRYIQLIARVNVSQATSLSFTNIALGSAKGGTVAVADTSNAGSNVDPDNDLDPRNNNDGTGVVLNSLPGTPHIGVAMMVRDTARQANGSYNVTYRVVVKNYGTVALKNVTLSDSLSKVFNQQVGASFSVLGTPIASAGSKLKVNPGFNGNTDPALVTGDSTSQLAVGAIDTLLVRINVVTNGQTGTFFNSVYAAAKAGLESVSDVSTNGMNPDLNGNNNPTDLNESEATPLNLPLNLQTVFIPEGFSPNGDGINDTFVITGTLGVTVSLEIFNRWGHRVYYSEDYKNDWDGKPNTGTQVGNTSNGLPDGTYFYVVKLSDGREYVRYMTINR